MMRERMCRVCAGAVADRARFCLECGTRVSVEPPAFVPHMVIVPAGRLFRHRQTLGVLWCVSGVSLLLFGVVAGVLLRFTAIPFGASVVPLIAVIVGGLAALSLAAGYGLLSRRSWGRAVALVAAVLGLLHPPFGTALGVYTIWVLGPGVE